MRIKLARIRDLMEQQSNGDISLSRMVELINEEASKAERNGKVAVVDLDNTVAFSTEREKMLESYPVDWGKFYDHDFDDKPIPEMVRLVGSLWTTGYDIVFCTARSEVARSKTVAWIEKVFPKCFNDYKLLMRDNSDERCSAEIKLALLDEHGYTPDKVTFVLDDLEEVVESLSGAGYNCLKFVESRQR